MANTIIIKDGSVEDGVPEPADLILGELDSTYFASEADYSDLAENYEADADIDPGTVVCFGGDKEVTTCTHDADTSIAGIVTTGSAFTMNSDLEAEFVVTIALRGRVPGKVSGSVKKGNMMVSNGSGGARAEANPSVGTVIGRALADSEGDSVIEIVVT